jgi:hypothetical protein
MRKQPTNIATKMLRAKRVGDSTYRRVVATFGEQSVTDLWA